MIYTRKNFAVGTLGIGLAPGDLSMTMSAGHTLPTTGTFVLVVWDFTTYPDPGTDPHVEIITAVYSGTTNVYTIVRAQESTSAWTHAAGNRVAVNYTAGVSVADLYVVGTKEIDETNIGDRKMPMYKTVSGKIEYVGEGDLEHQSLDGHGSNTHAQVDTHIADGTKHFLQTAIDHTVILNRGTNTHSQIDSYIVSHLPANINWRGAWAVGTSYQVNDVAEDAGSAYISTVAHSGHQPPNASFWGLLASKGDVGNLGETGAIEALDAKTAMVDADLFVIEDSVDSYKEKKMTRADFLKANAAYGVVVLDVSSHLPAVNGSALTGITILQLTDTPSVYTGSAAKSLKVNSGENAVEFGYPRAVYAP